MFGFIIPNFKTLNNDEKQRYQSVYCGLCHSLRDNYSNISRLALSYDLTFLVLLLSSLYEPIESEDFCNCLFHPGKKYKTSQNKYSDYCADITVMLAYHKLKDDILDNNSIKAKISQKAIDKHYTIAKDKHPKLCEKIEFYMEQINNAENLNTETSGDLISKNFGMILANIFAVNNDVFKDDLAGFGANLGRFIYFMDAAFDLQDDIKTGSYNPFKTYLSNTDGIDKKTAEQIKQQLLTFAGIACSYFEKLPLEQDLYLLQNILYEGA